METKIPEAGDIIRTRLRERLKATGRSAREVSLAVSTNDTLVRDILVGRSGSPRESTLRALALELETSVPYLTGDTDDPKSSVHVSRSPHAAPRPAAAAPVPLAQAPRDLPVLGFAEAGANGAFYDQGTVSGYVERPPSLIGVPDAYAVECWDESMFPRAEHGELLHVNPHKPVRPGNYVVLQLTDGRALFKRLVRRGTDRVVVAQLNPPREIAFDAGDVRAVHRVTGSSWDGN